MADITLSNVIKRYGDAQTIHGIDLDIKEGEFVVFVGPSGCGKSTLLRMIAGLEEISSGEIAIDGNVVNDIEPSARGIAMVFQSYALYPHMTVRENMGFGLKMSKVPKEKIDQIVLSAARTLQLEPLLDRTPKVLSGGQRQRVAIGRAIVRDPKVFLFDEPLSNLDAELRVEMRLQIAKLHQQLKNTMIYVTHDQVEAMTLADKIVVLRNGQVEQVGTPMELYHSPRNEFVAGFIGSPKMNFIPVQVSETEENRVKVSLPDTQQIWLKTAKTGVSQGDSLNLGIRPEHIEIGDDTEITLRLKSDVVERLGNSTYLFGEYAGQSGFRVQLPGDSKVMCNESLLVNFPVSRCHLFDQDGISLTSPTP
ncbi:sn-glycerol-3-phosphate ABC transporter ATP-binding protein UgpC [Parasalinivibrio latis]|uniref:ABC transporter ATP-binding protein n=1 Tax=Parasalinivibrio latis TaxID=2952610 RepID=UPI0030DEB972